MTWPRGHRVKIIFIKITIIISSSQVLNIFQDALCTIMKIKFCDQPVVTCSCMIPSWTSHKEIYHKLVKVFFGLVFISFRKRVHQTNKYFLFYLSYCWRQKEFIKRWLTTYWLLSNNTFLQDPERPIDLVIYILYNFLIKPFTLS